MKYSDGQEIKLGDIVCWTGSNPTERGIVICLIDNDLFLNGYDFTTLKNEGGGIMVFFDDMGLVQIMRDDEPDIDLIERQNISKS